MIFVLLQLAPPSAEVKDTMRKLTPAKPLIGTITVPLGCTRGCPPMPCALLAVDCPAPQVSPPSVEVLIWIHHDGAAPAQSAISRAADKHINRPCRGHYAKPGDDPHIVLGVKSNRG